MGHHTLVSPSARLQIKTHDLEWSFGHTMRMHGNTTAQDFLDLTGRLNGILFKI